jgi:hypothetical protein
MRAGVFLFPRLARQILFFPDWPGRFSFSPTGPADSLFPRLAQGRAACGLQVLGQPILGQPILGQPILGQPV